GGAGARGRCPTRLGLTYVGHAGCGASPASLTQPRWHRSRKNCLNAASPYSAFQTMSSPIPLRAAGQLLPSPRAWDESPGPATAIQSQPLERGSLASTHGQSENTPAVCGRHDLSLPRAVYRYANGVVL